jgi:hypothetical protein
VNGSPKDPAFPPLPFPEWLDSEVWERGRPFMLSLARKYIWWLRPEEALDIPARVIAEV